MLPYRTKSSALICLALLLQCGCTSLFYSAMAHLGKEKRDILVKRIIEAKKDQQATQEQLKTTLQAFQEVTGFKGGDLEKTYNRLNKEYERCQDRAGKLKDRVNSIDKVAQDLFSEWRKEIGGMRNKELRTQSETLLRNARQHHIQYMAQMRKTEGNIAPVLQAFSDRVIFLKHNLNAKAIRSLRTTAAQIDTHAAALVRDIDASSQEADDYIKALSADAGT